MLVNRRTARVAGNDLPLEALVERGHEESASLRVDPLKGISGFYDEHSEQAPRVDTLAQRADASLGVNQRVVLVRHTSQACVSQRKRCDFYNTVMST